MTLTRPPLVLVSRADRGWRTDPAAPIGPLSARSLYRLVDELRQAAGSQGAMLVFRTGDDELDAMVRRLAVVQRRAATADRQARILVDELLSRCDDWSSRDVAVLIGRSHQRVHQLRADGR
jgi:hypothetical protein